MPSPIAAHNTTLRMNDDCLFCGIINKRIPAAIVLENSEILAFDDIKPQAPVHIVIIPKAHIEKVSDVNEKNAHILGKIIMAANDLAAKRGIEKSGYRVVINCNKYAGQEIYHLHVHLLGGRPLAWPPG